MAGARSHWPLGDGNKAHWPESRAEGSSGGLEQLALKLFVIVSRPSNRRGAEVGRCPRCSSLGRLGGLAEGGEQSFEALGSDEEGFEPQGAGALRTEPVDVEASLPRLTPGSRGCGVNARFQQYNDRLYGDLGLRPHRKPNPLAEYFGRYDAADYDRIVDEYLRQVKSASRPAVAGGHARDEEKCEPTAATPSDDARAHQEVVSVARRGVV